MTYHKGKGAHKNVRSKKLKWKQIYNSKFWIEMIEIALFHNTTWWYVLIPLVARIAEINKLVCSAYKLAGAHMQ